MVKCGVFFAVRTEFLNIIYMSFGFKGLNSTENRAIFVRDSACLTVLTKTIMFMWCKSRLSSTVLHMVSDRLLGCSLLRKARRDCLHMGPTAFLELTGWRLGDGCTGAVL
jgi:hypothetical protein